MTDEEVDPRVEDHLRNVFRTIASQSVQSVAVSRSYQARAMLITAAALIVAALVGAAIIRPTRSAEPPASPQPTSASQTSSHSVDAEPAPSTGVPPSTTASAGIVPPVAVGGSVMLAAKAALEAEGFTVDAEVNRGPQEIIDELEALMAAGAIGDTVVVQVGLNGPITAADLDRIITLLPRSQTPNLVFMTERAPAPWIPSNNESIKALPARYPWISVLDWASLSNAISLCPDGIHLSCTREAVEYYTKAITDAVKPAGDTQAEP